MSYSRPPMGTLSEWLKIMLGEVARKQDDVLRAAAEASLRQQAPVHEAPRVKGKPS